MLNNEGEKTGDRILLSKMKEGDSVAFDELYERYWQSIYAAAFKRLHDPDQAKDVTQDVFLQLWHKREEISIDNLAAYLHTAARNKVYNLIEKERKYIPIPDLLVSLKANKDHADSDLLYKEFLIAYEALINSLTSSQQKIFRMRFQQDLSTSQIAEHLSISRKTVQNQLGKAVAQLRASLSIIALLMLINQ